MISKQLQEILNDINTMLQSNDDNMLYFVRKRLEEQNKSYESDVTYTLNGMDRIDPIVLQRTLNRMWRK